MQQLKIRNQTLREAVVMYTANQSQENNENTNIPPPSPSVTPYTKSELDIKNLYKKLPAYEQIQTIQVQPLHSRDSFTTGEVNRQEAPPRYDSLYPD